MNKIFKLMTAVMMVVTAFTFSACKKNFDNPPGAADPAIVANTSIKALKAMHTAAGAYDVITTDIIISGVVVADDKSGNLYKQLFIQDATGGLQIMLDANSLYGTYPVGRRIFIKCKDLCISDYNKTMMLGVKATVAGSPSLEGIPSNLISKFVVGGSLNNPVVPLVVTYTDLGGTGTTNMQDPLIGTLIQLNDYRFATPSGTYSDTSAYKSTVNRDINSCGSQTLIVRTSAYANFAAQPVAAGRGSILAIYTVFGNTRQLIIRDTSDVRFTSPYACALPPGTLFYEDFESLTTPTTFPYTIIGLPGWNNAAQAASEVWTARTFSANKYAYMSGFGTGQSTVTTWLVTPGIALTGATKTLTFKTIQGFILTTTPGGTPVQADLKVLVSTNYTGTGNPWAAGVVWTDLTSQATLSPGSTTSTFPSSFTNSGNINLNSYTGTIYIAFRYEGADPAGTTSDKTSAWEVDEIKVTGL
ncbi:MAG: choice-of-anchor J domain-containing protein [Chitinophagaceae bacterium]|nr:choice-of-anchor J domain-containing protein [Chitinophagaceae bacterium]MBK8786161.1 choice-of-anchor J domain-containing protein [Chitinophagaceae bacterium]MBK9485464.1 choice-of-anchor J domain-containing protein [Chitinophagaceae bacterium]MBL0200048.1 choice-of-anchor J domain-containing protein [Chitinophagaceae bacterium]